MTKAQRFPISRRSLLVGGGTGVGLLLAWGIWPRSYQPNLTAAPGETIFNAFLKIGDDGRIVVISPQPEMGQGIFTAFAQILADELGADWTMVSVEPAPINPLYANDLAFTDGANQGNMPVWLQGAQAWVLRQVAIRNAILLVGGSTSVRGFEQRYREAGATARALLCKAAARRWGADWRACDTADGFVVHGQQRLPFAALAAEAARISPPAGIALRKPGAGGISGRSVPRLDLPSKVDGSARFGADVQLPGLVYASIRRGPFGDTRFVGGDRAAARKIPGVIAIVENPRWVAAVATDWWAAERALDAMAPQFRTTGPVPDDASIRYALEYALAHKPGERFFQRGEPDPLIAVPSWSAEFRVPLAVHSPMETLNATARPIDGGLEMWLPTQTITFTRSAVARAVNIDAEAITIHQTLVGGSFGRKGSFDAAEIVAILATRLNRPVQLILSRTEEIGHDDYRPPAIGRLRAKLGADGMPQAWAANIAAPSTIAENFARAVPGAPGTSPDKPEAPALEGGFPIYRIPAVAMAHHVAPIGVPTGAWRSVGNSYNAFFAESFIDELAEKAGIDPYRYRMRLLGDAPRLAHCLATAARIGKWRGGMGSGQGIAAHHCYGSNVATMVELHVEEDRIALDRIIVAVDCGRMIHPDNVRQQIEGGVVWGISGALGEAISVQAGRVTATNFDGLGLPMLTDVPEIVVELIESDAPPGGVGEISVPTLAPALANALHTVTGRRFRALPIRLT